MTFLLGIGKLLTFFITVHVLHHVYYFAMSSFRFFSLLDHFCSGINKERSVYFQVAGISEANFMRLENVELNYPFEQLFPSVRRGKLIAKCV